MSNQPPVLSRIQAESLVFRGAVSESLLQTMGGSINALIDDITNISRAVLTPISNSLPFASGQNFGTIYTCASPGFATISARINTADPAFNFQVHDPTYGVIEDTTGTFASSYLFTLFNGQWLTAQVGTVDVNGNPPNSGTCYISGIAISTMTGP